MITAQTEIFYVAGAGCFGRQAITKLMQRPQAQVFVVEKNPPTVKTLLAEVPLAEDQVIVDDAVDFLSSYISQAGHASAWIIPTIPLHLTAAVISQLTGRACLTWDKIPSLPHTFLGTNGELYSSLADFVCPEDCPQPSDHCYTTGEDRGKSLVRILKDVSYHHYPSLVLQSRQLAPGMGGFQVAAISAMIEEINTISGPLVFSTACLCHGVSNVLGLMPPCHGQS